MTAAYVHVVIVHLPVVGFLFTFVLTLLGLLFRDRRLVLIGCSFALVCAVGAAVAYGSGPPAFEQLRDGFDGETRDMAQYHAVIGRAAFIGAIVAGLLALQALLRSAADDGPSPWLARSLVLILLVVAVTMAWAARLGGVLRHPEARSAPQEAEARRPSRSSSAGSPSSLQTSVNSAG